MYYKPEVKNFTALIQRITDEQTVIVRDGAFRKIAVSTYNHRCAFCGLQILDSNGRNIVDAFIAVELTLH